MCKRWLTQAIAMLFVLTLSFVAAADGGGRPSVFFESPAATTAQVGLDTSALRARGSDALRSVDEAYRSTLVRLAEAPKEDAAKDDKDDDMPPRRPSAKEASRGVVSCLGGLGLAVWITDRLGVWDIGHNGRQLAAGAYVVSVIF